jgi:hypothetical protein
MLRSADRERAFKKACTWTCDNPTKRKLGWTREPQSFTTVAAKPNQGTNRNRAVIDFGRLFLFLFLAKQKKKRKELHETKPA